MMEQGSRGKIGLKEEKKDKGWINGRRDDEVLRKGKYILWLREGERERDECHSLLDFAYGVYVGV